MLISTRDKEKVSSAKAIIQGMSSVGGLYVFENIKKIGFDESFLSMSYEQMAKKVLGFVFDDFKQSDIDECVDKAYNPINFPKGCVSLKHYDGYSFLNLFNGPTFAFKDMALTLLPHLLQTSKKMEGNNKKTVVLTATSGDTGSAALNGFTKSENTNIYVLYPYNRVSQFQEKQMLSFNGKNSRSFAVKGNFDDCQRTVKDFFNQEKFDFVDLSSANSINIGRLAPQIVYYFYAYCDLVNKGKIKFNDKINFCVPTGNFGDILAGYIASLLGLPVNKLICASNKNKVLTDFFKTGVYDANREFYTTNTPSMDILVSSNLERLLFMITNDASYVASLMNDLKTKGKYELDKKYLDKLSMFEAGYCEESDTIKLIAKVYNETSHLMDPHTAVAYGVYEEYKNSSKDNTLCVVLSTANPYKFNDTICKALNIESDKDEFVNIENIYKKTNYEIDPRILALKSTKMDRTIWSLEDTYNNLHEVVGGLND
ncbi:MAG: threonine synthase [Anaeroplasmataceae bacterium]